MKKILKLFIILSIVLICKTSTVFGVCNTESQLDNNLSTFKYKFDLNGNGGIFERSEITVIDGKVNLPTPVRSGYTFNGYTASKDGTVEYNVSNVDIYNINSKTLYAKWNIETYKINYDLNGGTLDNIVSEYNVENDITLGVPTRTGYTFVGWTGTGISTAIKNVTINKGSTGNRSYTANWVDDIKPDIYKAWITSGPYYEVINGRYGYTVNIQVSCGDSGSGINRVLTYYENSTGWVGETNITSTMTDSFWFIPGYRRIKIVVYDNAGNSSETIIAVQCG